MSNSDPSKEQPNLKRSHLLKGFRLRIILLALFISAVSFVLVAAAVLYFTEKNGTADMIGALSKTVSSFSYYCTQDYINLSRHAKSFIDDEKLSRLLSRGGDLDKIFSEADGGSLEELKNGLLVDMAGINDDLLLLTDKDGKICFNVVRMPSSEPNAEGGAAEVSFEQNKNENVEVYNIEDGSSIDSVFFEPLLKEERYSSGFMRFNADGPIYSTVGVLLDKEHKDFGFMVVGRRISESNLAVWGQGMSEGVLLLTSSNKVLMGYDNRSASRPTPLLASGLEMLLADWDPRQVAGKVGASGSYTANPGELQLIGKKWYAASSEILSAGKHELLGYAVFLVDTDSLTKERKQLLWILGACFVINLLLTAGLFYLNAPYSLRFILKELNGASS
ncbi:hypothetical protein IJT93_07425 [bacterium]|nr:hypothetical protein [bacterium]